MNMHVDFDQLQETARVFSQDTENGIKLLFSNQLAAIFDRQQQTMWLRMQPSPRPCFNPDLLNDLHVYTSMLDRCQGAIPCQGEAVALDYTVLASATPGVFNLGGDLNLFMRLINNRDRAGLLRYGLACVDVIYRNYVGYDQPVTTISLVQGECLGGGFEAALSSDLIIAERQARFGFPEILFNLFPGMGAYSFLLRRVGRGVTEQLLSTGKIYTAEDMQALGVIDQVVDTGCGETAIEQLIQERRRNRNGLSAITAARRLAQKLDYQELVDIVTVWVDAALRLTPRDLKLMQRLVARQNDMAESVAA